MLQSTELLTNYEFENYSGKHEMSKVSLELYQAIQKGIINENQLTEELFTESLFAVENHDVDLFIRTSGYKRISDFLSWQVTHKCICRFNLTIYVNTYNCLIDQTKIFSHSTQYDIFLMFCGQNFLRWNF